MTTFTFNTRDTYLAFRAEWRSKYQELSQIIRELKAQHREELASGKDSYKHYDIIRRRREANAMMQLLEEAKQESARQWAALRQGEAA